MAAPAAAGPVAPPIQANESDHGGPYLGIIGSSLDDRLSIGFAKPDFLITSPNGVAGCHNETATSIRCTRYGSPIGVFLYSGDDRLNLHSDRVRAVVEAGPGTDVLNGSEVHNAFYGDEGDDLIRGHAGKDTIEGGKGVDRMLGGRGKDHIYADDHRRDDRIDCGPGKRDLAVIDRHLDPRPRRCERVRFH